MLPLPVVVAALAAVALLGGGGGDGAGAPGVPGAPQLGKPLGYKPAPKPRAPSIGTPPIFGGGGELGPLAGVGEILDPEDWLTSARVPGRRRVRTLDDDRF